MGKIFVSYLRSDKDRVAQLVEKLTDLGADIWWDDDSLALNDKWRGNIASEVCHGLIRSPHSAYSRTGRGGKKGQLTGRSLHAS